MDDDLLHAFRVAHADLTIRVNAAGRAFLALKAQVDGGEDGSAGVREPSNPTPPLAPAEKALTLA